MTYREYVADYEALATRLMSYSPFEVGARVYVDKLAKLEERNPEHAARYDDENN